MVLLVCQKEMRKDKNILVLPENWVKNSAPIFGDPTGWPKTFSIGNCLLPLWKCLNQTNALRTWNESGSSNHVLLSHVLVWISVHRLQQKYLPLIGSLPVMFFHQNKIMELRAAGEKPKIFESIFMFFVRTESRNWLWLLGIQEDGWTREV